MADRDIFPCSASQSSKFRHGTSRKEQLGLKLEVEDVVRKSVAEIESSRQTKREVPLTQEEKFKRKLAPSFKPDKLREKRKTHPIFHDDLLPKSSKIQTHKSPTLPRYNALDRDKSPTRLTDMQKTNRFPYSRETTVTTEGMKKPHVTTMGVVPIRDSKQVTKLNVVMEGRQALTNEDPILGPVERANTAPNVTPVPPEVPSRDETEAVVSNKKEVKPAICGGAGTTLPVTLVERPAPPSKPKSQLYPARTYSSMTSKSAAPSVRSVDLLLPDDEDYQDDDVMAEPESETKPKTRLIRSEVSRQSDASSTATVKSTKDLLNEAKQLSTPAPSKTQRRMSRVSTKDTLTKSKGKLEKRRPISGKSDSKSKASKMSSTPERSVDEIISSLRDQSKSGTFSEADRKIHEIMGRVMNRSSEVLVDLDYSFQPEVTESPEQEEEDDELASTLVDNLIADETKTDQYQEKEHVIPAIEVVTEDDVDKGARKLAEKIWEEMSRDKDDETTVTYGESGESDGEDEQEGFQESFVQPQPTIDLNKAWEDLNAPSQVTYEDIISVKASTKKIYTKEGLVKEEPVEDEPTLLRTQTSFISSWAPQGKLPGGHTTRAGRSIHHFCTLTDDIQVPDQYRGVWRRHHVPGKHNYLHSQLKSLHPLGSAISEVQTSLYSTGDMSAEEREKMTRQQSAAATRILVEAYNMNIDKSDTLQAWQQKAQQMFDQSEITVDGRKITLKADESCLYWTPAPPKWDVAPPRVKEHLFPAYTGGGLSVASQASHVAVGEDIEEEEEEADFSPPSRMSKHKMIGRNIGSARDLTDLEKTKLDLLETPRAGKVSTEDSRDWTPEGDSEIPSISQISSRVPTAQKGGCSVDIKVKLDMDWDETYTESNSSKCLKLKHALLKQILRNNQDLDRLGLVRTDIQCSRGSVEVKLDLELKETISQSERELLQTGILQALRGYNGYLFMDGDYIKMTSDPVVITRGVDSPVDDASSTCDQDRFGTEVPSAGEDNRKHKTEAQMKNKVPTRRRRNSAPDVMNRDEDFLLIYQDFTTAMVEVKNQRQQLKEMAAGIRPVPGVSIQDEEEAAEEEQPEVPEEKTVADTEVVKEKKHTAVFAAAILKSEKPTPAELALEAGRSYVILPKKKKKRARTADMVRIEELEKFLTKPANKLQRTESMPYIKKPIERELRVPQKVRSTHRRSLSNFLDFESYKLKRGYRDARNESEREWVRGVWNQWFEQTFPVTPEPSEWDESEFSDDQVVDPKEDQPKSRKTSTVSTVYPDTIQVYPVIEEEGDEESVQMLQEEVERLTNILQDNDNPRAFDYSRRGAILRKLGKIEWAIHDLNKAITLEPLLLDAYWHRHLIYVLQNKKQLALDDLNLITKHNRTHIGAYRARAAIYRSIGDVTMAIVNYSQAIKHKPDDCEAYFERADMYEKRGEMLLAMEDYASVTKINPTKTVALFKHGVHYFNNKNWHACILDFTELLKEEPMNAEARLYRSRAYVQLKQWNPAIRDLSATIHLDPRNASAFYHRGCILRKLHPKRALQDFSVSLLLDNSYENILAYLHRGILYNDIGRHEDAIPDFESVLKLDHQMAIAHVNLGLIYMLKMDNYHRSINKFTAGIKADPTYVKAYVCRAEAYTRIHDIKNALLDYTRAIHMQPDVHHFYICRGELVLKSGNLELASFCVRHAAELNNAGLGQSPTQQAIVQSFLKNYDKAIEALEGATKVKPSAPLFVLLGKAQMKAGLWKNAVTSFESAIELVGEDVAQAKGQKPWQRKEVWPLESAEMYYAVGICHTEMRDFLNAFEAFNSAIRINPKFAEAFYQRGLSRVKLRQSKGIQDFNRALALDPTLFQVYLSRAAFYGLRKQYSKGILNCNEAIKLQPDSVRAYLYRGALKYHIKAYTLAIRDLTASITIDNTCALAYFNRAVCYHDSNHFEKALQDYGIVLMLGEELMLKVLVNRGLLYFKERDYRNAQQDFLLAAGITPKDKKLEHTLALCYHKLQKHTEAIQRFTKSLEADPFFLETLISRGNVYMDFGTDDGYTKAKHDYERALMLNPRSLPARVNLAYCLQVEGKYFQAWHQFTITLQIDQNFQPALEGRAIINLQMSDMFAAFQDINASVRVGPTAELLTNRGVIHQFMGDIVNAMRDYQRAIKLDCEYSLAYFNAGNVYFYMRQFQQALDFYTTCVKFNHKDESAFLNRAITKVLLKDAAGALVDFEKAIRLSPYSAHMYFNRGNLYASMSQYEKADVDYTRALDLQPDDPLVHKRRADVRGKLGRTDDAIEDYRRAIDIQTRPHQ